MSSGLNGAVNAIAVTPNGHVYVGGEFTLAGGVSVKGIARWDGSWHDVGDGVTDVFDNPGSVNALAVNGTDVYAGGNFANAGSVSAAYVARWDSAASQWESLGSTLSYEVDGLDTNGTELYIAGRTNVNGGFRFYQYILADETWSQLAQCASPGSDSERI